MRINSAGVAFRFFIYVQQHSILHKNSLNLGLKQYIVDTGSLKHSKQLMHVQCACVWNNKDNIYGIGEFLSLASSPFLTGSGTTYARIVKGMM